MSSRSLAIALSAVTLVATSVPALAADRRGSRGDDTIVGTNSGDRILGARGDDRLTGRGGNDRLLGGVGDDLLAGDSGADRLVGGPGQDTYLGGAGADVILAADGEADRITCGAGRDRVEADSIDTVAPDCERRD